jgi:hypothetical protein
MLASVDGRELWRSALQGRRGAGQANAVTVDEAGDVIVAGETLREESEATNFTVLKLSGTTGSLTWRADFAGAPYLYGRATAVATDGRGIVVAAGSTAPGHPGGGTLGSQLAVVWLAAESGAEIAHLVRGEPRGGGASAVERFPDGGFLVTGTIGLLRGLRERAIAVRLTASGS